MDIRTPATEHKIGYQPSQQLPTAQNPATPRVMQKHNPVMRTINNHPSPPEL